MILNTDASAWLEIAADLKAEAQNWLDGNPIQSDDEAAKVALLINLCRDHTKSADEERKAKTKPLDDAKKTIMEAYKPALDTFESIATVAKKATAAYMVKKQAERDAAAKAERERLAAIEAELLAKRQAAASLDEHQSTAEQFAQLQRDAERVEREAKKSSAIKGGGRTISLKSVYTVEVTDKAALLKWFWQYRQDELTQWAISEAQRLVRASSGNTTIDGIKIIETKEAV